MNSTASSTNVEFVNSPLIPEFLLIQEIGFTLSLVFILFMYWMMLKVDDESYSEVYSTTFVLALISFFPIAGYLLYNWGPERLLFAFTLSLSIVLTFVRPVLGLCCFLAFLLYRPWELMPEDPIVIAIPKYFGFMVFGVFLLKKFCKGEFFLIWNMESTYLVLFSVWVMLSIFKTSNFNESMTLFQGQFTRPIIIFFLMINLIRTRLDFLAVQGTFVMTVVFKGIVSVFHTLNESPTGNLQEAAAQRLTGIGALADSNDLAAVFIIALPLLISFFFSYRKTATSFVLGAIATLFSFYLIWMTRSRGAIIALLALIASYIFSRLKTKKMKIMAIAFVVAAFFPLTLSFNRSSSDLEESSSNRINYWKTATIMALRNPFLGVGYNAYPENYERYAPTLISEFGYRTAHSTWFLVLGETGFVGLLFFLLLYFEILKKSFILKLHHPELYFALIAYSVTMTFLSHAYIIYPYILFSLISAGARIYKDQAVSEVAA